MLRRLALQIRSTRRSPAPVVPPTQPLLLCRFSHIVVVLTNVLQLVLMLSFLVTLLLQLNQTIQVSWFVVFITLWASDSITFVMGVLEFYHLAIAPEDRRSRNSVITQFNRIKGCLCVVVFKFLLAMRQDGIWPDIRMSVVCSPYYFAAMLRFVLHFMKEPVGPDGGNRNMRPGTPINPVHVMIFIIAFRVDQFNHLSWGATFWPMWILFALLLTACLVTGCLAIGILLTREPRDRSQRVLFFLCYGILLSITSTGLAFLITLTRRLDGDESISYTAIILPLIVGYSALLVIYLVFTLVLPRLMIHDVAIASLADDDSTDDEEEGGMIEAVSQQLAPPVLVQQSATLFRRMSNTAMFERFIKAPPQPAEVDRSNRVGDLAISDLDGDMGTEELASISIAPNCESAPTDDESGKGTVKSGNEAPDSGIELEYAALHSDIKQWVRNQQLAPSTHRKARQFGPKGAIAPMVGDGVPSEIKDKLQRLFDLNQQVASAACEVTLGKRASSSNLERPPDAPSIEISSCAESSAYTATASASGEGTEDGSCAESSTYTATASASGEGTATGAIGEASMSALISDVIPTRGMEGSDSQNEARKEGSVDAMDSLCLICFEGPRDAVLLECGHGGICYSCAWKCFKKKKRECPMCRQPVSQVVHIRLDGPEPECQLRVVRVRQLKLPAEFT